MSDYNNYGLGKVSISGNEFIEAWQKSKDDFLKEIITARGMDSEEFDMEGMMKFTRLMTLVKRFESLTLDMCKCMDAQIKEIRDLKQEIRELKHETKVVQDSIYELTNKVEEVLEKDEEPKEKYTSNKK